MSFKIEVKTPGDSNWSSNSVRFATEDEAKTYGKDLFMRWTSVTEYQVTGSEDLVNYIWDADAQRAVPVAKAEVA